MTTYRCTSPDCRATIDNIPDDPWPPHCPTCRQPVRELAPILRCVDCQHRGPIDPPHATCSLTNTMHTIDHTCSRASPRNGRKVPSHPALVWLILRTDFTHQYTSAGWIVVTAPIGSPPRELKGTGSTQTQAIIATAKQLGWRPAP